MLRHSSGVAQVWVGGVGWDEGVCLGGDGGEDAFLVEAEAVGAASVWGGVEAVTANLGCVRGVKLLRFQRGSDLPCAACNTDMLLPFAASVRVG